MYFFRSKSKDKIASQIVPGFSQSQVPTFIGYYRWQLALSTNVGNMMVIVHVNSARPWCPVVWSGTSLNVAVKVFCVYG